jgi:hypothetical protein
MTAAGKEGACLYQAGCGIQSDMWFNVCVLQINPPIFWHNTGPNNATVRGLLDHLVEATTRDAHAHLRYPDYQHPDDMERRPAAGSSGQDGPPNSSSPGGGKPPRRLNSW